MNIGKAGDWEQTPPYIHTLALTINYPTINYPTIKSPIATDG